MQLSTAVLLRLMGMLGLLANWNGGEAVLQSYPASDYS